MVTEVQLRELIADMESNRIERTVMVREDKLGPAVCALSNDFPNHKKPGYILLGIKDDGTIAGTKWNDEDLQKIGGLKTNGNVLPPPSIVVSPVFKFPEGEVVVIEVKPSLYPPVRYDGRCWIRIGPRRGKATIEEEKILIERRASNAKTYDISPCIGSILADINVELFKTFYLPKAIDKETYDQNNRDIKEQLASLRFYDLQYDCPTNAGILLFAEKPVHWIGGAYIQFVKFPDVELTPDIVYEKEFKKCLCLDLMNLDEFIQANIIKKTLHQKPGSMQDEVWSNYSLWAIRELIFNAVIHRNYESNAPILIYEFSDRIEIKNPGYLYGQVSKENFPNVSDYRNMEIAEALKVLGYINKFNFGVKNAIRFLIENGNPEPVFDLSLVTGLKVTIPIHKNWKTDKS